MLINTNIEVNENNHSYDEENNDSRYEYDSEIEDIVIDDGVSEEEEEEQ